VGPDEVEAIQGIAEGETIVIQGAYVLARREQGARGRAGNPERPARKRAETRVSSRPWIMAAA